MSTTPGATGYLHLNLGSPAINKGSNQLYTDAGGDLANDKDLAGNTRLADNTIDIGAYEFQGPFNKNPVITSNGGGTTASVDVPENTTAVTTVTALDDDGDDLVFGISGGADASAFSIDVVTGVLTFKVAPDFENPTDVDNDNLYVVTVEVDDGNGGTATQTISVRVTDVDEIPPAVPSGLRAIASDGRIVLDWTANTESDLKEYKIYWGTATNSTTVITIAKGTESYTHTGLVMVRLIITGFQR